MKANINIGELTTVPINTLEAFPSNPRRGDIEAIAASLKAHGQYRPIVVQKGTNYILAGNHTYKAAKKLGWKKIVITYIDTDDTTARKIVLADNRLTDLATYNEPLLKNLLQALPDVEGTGFTAAEVETLDRLIDGTDKNPIGGSTKTPTDPEVRIAAWRFTVDLDVYTAWKEELYAEFPTKQKAIKGIKQRLGLPEPKPVTPEPQSEPTTPLTSIETVPTTDLLRHPLNPREGDIGAIVESLKHTGQYRPIVANKTTKHILSGNHTYSAAVLLGWEKVAVHWVEVDEIEEIKILIVDNRTSDLATYDPQELNKLLTNTPLNGTGFTPEEVAEILQGGKSKPGHQPVGRTTIKVGDHTMRIHTEDLNQWANTINTWQDIAELLHLPTQACTTEVE